MSRSLPNKKDLAFGRIIEGEVSSNLTTNKEPHRWYNEHGEEWGRDFYLTKRHCFLEVEGRRCTDRRGRDILSMALLHGVHFRKDTVDHCWDLSIPTFYMVLWDDFKTFHLVHMETLLREGTYVEVDTNRGVDEFYRLTHLKTYTGVFR